MSGPGPELEAQYTFGAITRTTFDRVLSRYRTSVMPPEEGKHLDNLRYKTIPDALEARGPIPHLEKDELVTLVTWKLKHGTFRPSLKSLVQQNNADEVERTSRTGFREYKEDKPKDAIKTLSSLRGIGPATASLMLSAAYPTTAPFFSDELFRWTFYESGKGNGWDRRIKYTAKEYADLYEKVHELVDRLSISAVDAEKVAYVLGKDDARGTRSREDLGKSSKRKADEIDHGVAVQTGSSKTDAATGTEKWDDAIKKDRRQQGLPEKVLSDQKDARSRKQKAVGQPTDSGSRGRPKRKSRKT